MKISINNLTFAYDGAAVNIFENVTLSLDTNWKLGLIGRNGRGKTTLLRLLSGELDGSGSIYMPCGVNYFPYNIKDISLTAEEFLQSEAPEAKLWQIHRELSLLDVNTEAYNRPIFTLSGGERTKLLLAAMFLKDETYVYSSDMITDSAGTFFHLIDEPTDHLDSKGREDTAKYLASKKGFILVSHDRAFLDGTVDHILSINRSSIELTAGNYSVWKENRDKQDKFELDENERLKTDIERLTAAAARTSEWADKVESSKIGALNSGVKADKGYIGHKSAKMMKRAKSIETRTQEAINEKRQLLKNIEEADTLKIHCVPYKKKRLVEFYKAGAGYNENRILFSDLSFTVENGDRIAVRGKNGSGKSTVLKILTGEADLKYKTGSFNIGSDLKISYVPQECSELSGSIREYAQGVELSLFFAILRKLDFTREQFDVQLQSCSEGQKKKVAIARSLSQEANLYIWDEPLNFIDILSREQIEKLILEYAPTMIFVEHDSVFTQKIQTKEIFL